MFTNIVKEDIGNFPNSFHALQQECFLINSCLLSGFEFMVKGSFSDVNQGHYYAALFQLSIGLERILKLTVASDHILGNVKENKKIIHEGFNKDLKSKGHNLIDLYETVCNLSVKYDHRIPRIEKESTQHKILDCIDRFAQAPGRYYHISNIEFSNSKSPLETLQDVHEKIKGDELSETKKRNIENRVFKNLSPTLQIDDIANNTGYVHDFYAEELTREVNPYIVLNLVKLLIPIIDLLNEFSLQCHEIQTTKYIRNYPTIPYYGEFFDFRFTTRRDIMRRKCWTSFL